MKMNLDTGLIKNIIQKEQSILAAYIFGSAARGKANKYSDIDIAVLFDTAFIKEADFTDKQIEIMNNLSQELKKEVDVVILNSSPLALKFQVIKEGLKIYERPDRKEHDFEARSIVQYLEFLPIKNMIENGLLAKIKEA